MWEQRIENEGHTLACLLREGLFECGATFAACTVAHPQDTHMTVCVDSDDPPQTLLDAIADATSKVERCLTALDAYEAHQAAAAVEATAVPQHTPVRERSTRTLRSATRKTPMDS